MYTHTCKAYFLPPLSLTDFDASHNQITYVPSGLFQMPELVNLHLSYNLLNSLPGDLDDPSAQSNGGTYVYTCM